MTTPRRQSSSYSEDLSRYEFVDYTSVSSFEKFITHIEETLYSWGVKEGSFGVFSYEQLATARAAIAHPSAAEYTRKETLAMGDDVFQLTYHYHPTIVNDTTAAEHFYQYSTTLYHPLHRWSGQDRLMIIRPMQDSLKKKIFNSNKSSVDSAQAKQLISACAIAFQNTGCRVPVFVPVGQSRHEMYMGYSVTSGLPDLPTNETEMRFNMSLTTPPVSHLSYLDGLKTLFLQKLSVHREDYGRPGQVPDSSIYISAVYTYNLKNWFDENWKEWEDVVEKEVKRKGSFSDDFEAWGDDDEKDDSDGEGGEGIASSSSSSSISAKRDGSGRQRSLQDMNQHRLSFGSFNDPLRTLTLSALFPLIQEDEFHEAYDRNMDALTAKQWQLSREFAPVHQQRGYLATLIGQAIDSWVKDPTNKEYLAPYDDSNDDSVSDNNGLMHNLFAAGNRNKFSSQTGTSTPNSSSSTGGLADPVVVKSDEVEDVLTALFYSMVNTEEEKQENARYGFDSTKKLGLKLKTGATVPYRSFLWNLLLYSLEAASNNSSTSSTGNSKRSTTNFLGFLRIIWLEVLRQIRWHWENLVPLPDLNPYLYDSSSDEKHSKTLGIDLRYNILHQKLSMVNCCIHRRLQNSPQNGDAGDHNIKPVKRVGNLFDRATEERESKASKFQTLIERFVDGGAESNSSENMEDSVCYGDNDAVSDDSDVFLDATDTVSSKSINSNNSKNQEDEVIVANPMQESFVSLTNDESETDETNAIKDPDAFEGRLQQHETLKLLKTGEPMYIPITQDPGFMTEDMITEQADVFESLGTSENATQQRAKLQSAQLFSDMQAFKAANPHACLEDFVRWHSPRDWIADKDSSNQGQLSTRMSEPSNIWQDLWKCSKRIPCTRQKPLFNITVEAEKALFFLETTSIHEFFSIMLPTLGLIAYDTLSSHPIVQYSEHVCNGLNHIASELAEFPWEDFRHGKRTFDSMLSLIRQQESIMCHAISLLRKLPMQYRLVDQLLLNEQAIVKEGNERSSVFQLFRNGRGVVSEPSFKEYLFYSDCKDLTINDRILPQRQYAVIKDNEIRIMDMQTTDALYN